MKDESIHFIQIPFNSIYQILSCHGLVLVDNPLAVLHNPKPLLLSGVPGLERCFAPEQPELVGVM